MYIGVPYSVMDQIGYSQSYSSKEEKRLAGLQYYLQTVPGVSWGRIAGVLWYMEEHTALVTVRQYLPHKHGDYLYIHVHVHVHTQIMFWPEYTSTLYMHVYMYFFMYDVLCTHISVSHSILTPGYDARFV